MIRCPKCGCENQVSANFCEDCGSPLQQQSDFANISDNMHYKQQSNSAKSSRNTPLLIIVAMLLIIIICCVIIGTVMLTKKDNNAFIDNSVVDEQVSDQNQFTSANVLKVVNDYISSCSSHNDIAVAIINNKTSERISSNNSSDIYSSWGCYYPVYLAYIDYYGYNANVLNNILSSDAGVCNNAANSAIKHMGGTYATTSRLYNLFGCNATSYGRFFGDVTATTDNYTNANEAVSLLHEYNKVHYSESLSYNPSRFGITPPNGTAFNCQIGTENISKRVNLNIYAIVKGSNSDYCVVILTRNSEGKEHISKLLSVIHTNMEELSK